MTLPFMQVFSFQREQIELNIQFGGREWAIKGILGSQMAVKLEVVKFGGRYIEGSVGWRLMEGAIKGSVNW